MVTYNGANYYYKHNHQGDIIGIINADGNTVVSYVYDSWGNQLSCSGSLANTLGSSNPLRYRSYIYDSETGLYYLQNRYYNPVWGRFLNSDTFYGEAGVLLTHNMFSYCYNNPVNTSDPSGNWPPDWLIDFLKNTLGIDLTGSTDNNSATTKLSSGILSYENRVAVLDDDDKARGQYSSATDSLKGGNIGIGSYSNKQLASIQHTVKIGSKDTYFFQKQRGNIGNISTFAGLRTDGGDLRGGITGKMSALAARGTIGIHINGWSYEIGMNADAGALGVSILGRAGSNGFVFDTSPAVGFGFGFIIRATPDQ